MFELRDLVFGILLPGTLAALAALAAALAARGRPHRAVTAGAVAGALTGLVVALCHAALLGWPPVPPPSLDPWVPWYAVVATLGALVEAALVWSKAPSGEQAPAPALQAGHRLLPPPMWLRLAARLPALALLGWVLTRIPTSDAGTAARLGATAAVVVTGLLLGLSLDLLLLRRGPLGGALLLLAWAGPLTGALLGSGSLVYGKLGACVAAVAGGLLAGGGLTRLLPSGLPALPALALGAAPPLAAAVVSLLLRGTTGFSLVWPSAIALLLAPSAAWLAEPLRRSPARGRRLAGEALGLLLVAAVAGGAATYSAAQLEEPDPSAYPY